MEKINFEDGVTKVNAETFTEFQDNIEKACVAISLTQPSTSENVWIRKGKNLLNPQKLTTNSDTSIVIDNNNNPIVTQTNADTATNIDWTVYKRLNGSYVGAIKTVTNAGLETLDFKFKKDSSFDELAIGVSGVVKNTFVLLKVDDLITSNKYVLSYRIINNTQGSLSFDSIQLENGEDLSSFEPYVENKILVKDTNNFFNEFKVVESGGNEKGNWIKYEDGTMICYYNQGIQTAYFDVEYGSVWLDTNAKQWNFPVQFIAPPIININSYFAGEIGGVNIIHSPTNASVTCQMFSVKQVNTLNNVSLFYTAIGRWK